MTKQKILFIINPISGKGNRKNDFEGKIYKNINKKKFEPILKYSKYQGHGSKLVKEHLLKGIVNYVAVGGDGTVNEIASALIDTKAQLTILPRGSGNGLARHLQISNSVKKCVKKINRGKSIEIDTAELNGIRFFCTAGIGFDAYCAQKFAEGKHSRGLLNYIKIALKSYFSYKTQFGEFDGIWKPYFNITFGNSNQFGNNAYICPDANISDGLLDCTIIKPHNRFKSLFVAYRLFNKTLLKSNLVESYQQKEYHFASTNNVLIQFDGESRQLNTNKIHVKLNPKSLKVTI